MSADLLGIEKFSMGNKSAFSLQQSAMVGRQRAFRRVDDARWRD